MGKKIETQSKLIFFRADGNVSIGSGHIMRCLSLAKAFRKLSYTCIFISADSTMQKLVEDNHFKYLQLNSDWNLLDSEQTDIVSIIQSYKPSLFIVDSYFISSNYFDTLSKNTTVIYIDDMHTFDYNVSGVINYNIFSDTVSYHANTTVFSGLNYVPMRSEFSNLPKRNIHKLQDILILTGGSDSENCALRFLDFFETTRYFNSINLHFVLGFLYPHIDLIIEKSSCYPNIYLHQNVTNMSDLMQRCDIAISASGSTLYELCACGTPTLIYSLADNQLEIAQTFSQKGYMAYFGDMRETSSSTFHQLNELLLTYYSNPQLLQDNSAQLQQLVDGNGAMRLATDLISTFLLP